MKPGIFISFGIALRHDNGALLRYYDPMDIQKYGRLTAYFISGLGADRRIFCNLRLPDEITIVHLDWIEPQKGESMTHYCQRMATNINTREDFALVGVSLGGMIATELSQILQPKFTIIISSAGCRSELPWYLRLVGITRIYSIVSLTLLKIPTPFTYWIFGMKGAEERHLLRQILKDTSPTFLKWATRAILTWTRIERPLGIYHIHGACDRILPVQYTKADRIVPSGGHLMVFSMAEPISKLLTEGMGCSK